MKEDYTVMMGENQFSKEVNSFQMHLETRRFCIKHQ